MAWLFGWDNKKDLVKHLRAEGFYAKGYKALRHSLKGNRHWSLLQRPDGSITIALETIKANGSDGWGYKGETEGMVPNALSCPISYLDAVTAPQSEEAAQWRERVKAYHRERSSRPAYAAGQVWRVFDKDYQLSHPAGERRGWVGTLKETGEYFRIPARYLSGAKLVSQ